MSMVITIDAGVEIPDGRPRVSPWAIYNKQLCAMAVGDSFFIGRGTRNDVRPLMRYAAKLGIALEAHEVEEDEIYLVAGVRVWRVDGVPRVSSKFWRRPDGSCVKFGTEATADSRTHGYTPITEAEFKAWETGAAIPPANSTEALTPAPEAVPPQAKANPTSLYWRTEEGACIKFKSLPKGVKLAELEEMCTPITEAEYKAWEEEQEL